MILHRLDEIIYRAYYCLKEDDYFEFAIIIVVLDEELIHKVFEMVKRKFPEFEVNLKIIIGVAEFDEESGQVYGFRPYDEISAYRGM